MITPSATPTNSSLPPLLKMREVAKILSLSRASVHALVESGDLVASPLNPSRRRKQRTHVRITSTSLLALYRKRFGHALEVALLNPARN